MFHITRCPICGMQNFKTELSCTDHTVSHETFTIVSCTHCQFHLTNPRPDNESLGQYYLSQNYISHSNKSKSIIDIIYRVSRLFTLRWKFNLVKKQINQPAFTLLDYGCGAGDFLLQCQKQKITIQGVEPSENARKIAQEKLNHHIRSDISELHQKFTAITMWHVLEHIPDLQEKIHQLKEHLDENGTIFIAVPNHNSYDSQKYKNEWAGYDVPRHLWHFSQDNMQQLLHHNDLILQKIVPMKLDSFYVSILSNKYRHGQTTISGFINGVITGLISNVKARKSNNYSSLIYIASKK
jgi:ubiquinone/menaquinone biosynthesis C-methylase UbiE